MSKTDFHATPTFEVDEPELEAEDYGDEDGVSDIENEYGDEDEGEIPPEIAKKLLAERKEQGGKIEVRVSGPKGKTVLGKQIRAKLQSNGLYKLYFKEGGELPDILKGQYTSVKEVENAVDHYLHTANKVIAA